MLTLPTRPARPARPSAPAPAPLPGAEAHAADDGLLHQLDATGHDGTELVGDGERPMRVEQRAPIIQAIEADVRGIEREDLDVFLARPEVPPLHGGPRREGQLDAAVG